MSEKSDSTGQAEGQENNNDIDWKAKAEEAFAQLENEKKSKERILNESKKYKEGYQKFKSEQDEATKQKELQEEQRLRDEGQFKVLLEQREARIQELEGQVEGVTSENSNLKGAIGNFKKAAAFERELGGKLKKEAYWNHVDFDAIATNPETGAIDELSLKKVAGGFLEDFKELVDFGNNANLPNGTAGGTSGKLTHEQWQALPLAERKKRMKDVKL